MIGSREGAQHLPISHETRAGMKGGLEGPHARSGLLIFFLFRTENLCLAHWGLSSVKLEDTEYEQALKPLRCISDAGNTFRSGGIIRINLEIFIPQLCYSPISIISIYNSRYYI